MTRTQGHRGHKGFAARDRALCPLFPLCPLSCASASAQRQEPAGARSRSRPRNFRPRSPSSAISITPRGPTRRGPSGERPAAQAVPALAAGCLRAGRRLRALPGARPADRVQRSAHQGRDARGARQPERPPPHRRLQLLRAQPRSRDDPGVHDGARQGAGRIRPAGARSRAGVARRRQGDDVSRVRQALVREVSRGEDFFRSAVIEALGDYKAAVRARRADRGRQSSMVRCRTMRRWRWERSATSARSTRWPASSARRRARRSHRSRPRSVCSTSTVSLTRATWSRR